MWQQLIQWLEQHQIACRFQKYFGIPCPGCGIQSAFIALLKGNILESIQLYPALIPMLLFLILLLLHLRFKFSWGALALKILFLLSLGLVILHFSLQLHVF